MDEWLKQTILTCTPVNFGYDTNLWTIPVIVELLEQKFGVTVGAHHLSL
jgi:transposase